MFIHSQTNPLVEGNIQSTTIQHQLHLVMLNWRLGTGTVTRWGSRVGVPSLQRSTHNISLFTSCSIYNRVGGVRYGLARFFAKFRKVDYYEIQKTSQN